MEEGEKEEERGGKDRRKVTEKITLKPELECWVCGEL